MNPDPEQFEQLRKLLSLKRHEQPPPGYFPRFSGQVIARIKAGEQGQDGPAWLRKLWSYFETKPMLTGAMGAAVCALVISGIVFTDETGTSTGAAPGTTAGLNPLAPSIGGSSDNLALNQGPNQNQFVSSTNPVSPLVRSLFDQPQINAQPASSSFGFPGN
jgi:hypothetical protein